MTYRGYLKDSGGAKRLRFVMPGYDADDEDVPPNKVIFDSNNIGTLSVIATGRRDWINEGGTGGNVQIASWSLPYVPLCTFQFSTSTYDNGESWNPATGVIQPLSSSTGIFVSTTGIIVNLNWSVGNLAKFSIRWQAYRLPVI